MHIGNGIACYCISRYGTYIPFVSAGLSDDLAILFFLNSIYNIFITIPDGKILKCSCPVAAILNAGSLINGNSFVQLQPLSGIFSIRKQFDRNAVRTQSVLISSPSA